MSAATTSLTDRAIMDTTNAAAIKYPADAARIARAGQLLLAGAVRQVTPLLWLVYSQSDASTVYSVVDGRCECPDAQYRRNDDYSCVHGLAVWLHGIAQQRAAVLAAKLADGEAVTTTQPARLTADEIRRLSAWRRRYSIQAAGFSTLESERILFTRWRVRRTASSLAHRVIPA